MTNKEELQDKFDKFVDSCLYPEIDPKETFDFFWKEIEQIRKSDMERVFNEIEQIDYTLDTPQIDFKLKVLSIIKQAHEN